MENKFELGCQVRDRLTGQKGKVIGVACYMYRVQDVLVLLDPLKDGDNYSEDWYQASGRLEIIE